MDSVVDTKTKILAYLGQLKKDELAAATKLCVDLGLRYTTAKNTLTVLEHRGLVVKKISVKKGTVASFRIPADAVERKWDAEANRFVHTQFVPPDWESAYGKHPHAV